MRAPNRDARFTSVVAGQAAGLAMLGAFMLIALSRGNSPVFALQFLTALFAGPQALQHATLGTTLPGVLAHQLGPSLLWARIFAVLVGFRRDRLPLLRSLGLGLLIGTAALLTDVYLFMPKVQQQLNDRDLWALYMDPASSWLTHVVYGGALGFFYWLFQERK